MKKYALLVVLWLLCCAAPVWAEEQFTGTWDTNYGPLTMVQKDKTVTGSYYDNKASLKGTVTRNRLTFNYLETGEKGDGEFTLAPDGNSFVGRYRTVGSKDWHEWNGTRK